MVTIGLAVILRSSINFIWDAYPHGLDIGVGRTIVRIGSIGVRTGQIAVIVDAAARCSPRSGRSSATARSASRCAPSPPTTAPRC